MGIALKHLSEAERARIARSLYKVTSEDKNRDELIGLCPIHGESNPSFSYNYQKDVYACLSCGAAGDLLKLWCEVHKLNQKEGFKAFCNEFGIKQDKSDSSGYKTKSFDSDTFRQAWQNDNNSSSVQIQEPTKTCNLPKNENGVCSHVSGMCDDKKCCNNCAENCSSRCDNSTPAISPTPGELTHEQVIEQMNRAWEKFPPLTMRMISDLKTKRCWSPSIIEILDLRLETWRLSKKGELYQVKEPVKIAIPVRDASGNLINIRLYQPGAKEFKIISFGKTTGKSALFPVKPLFDDKPVLLTEGESDTICALSHGFNAITQTSKLKKWPPEHLAPFKGRDVIIAYDADEAGQKYARFAAEALAKTAKSIRMVQWPAFMGVDASGAVPRDHGQDLTDFFARHGKSADDLQALIDNAAPWPPAPLEVSEPSKDNLTQDSEKNPVSGNGSGDGTVDDTNDVLQFFDYGVSDRKSFKPRLLAEKLLQDNKLLFDPGPGKLYRWNGKYWQEFEREHLENSCTKYLRIEANKNRVADAAYQARILSTIPIGRSVNDRDDFICIQNGMLNINTFEIVPHDPDFMATYALPVSLDPESDRRCVNFEHYLETSVQDPESIAQLQEFAGYIISRDTKYEKCLFLLGPGRDGKSKFINAMKDMVGIDNISAVSFADLEKEFARSSLYNKMLNTSTEIGSNVIESSYFKAITSGDPIQAAFKHKDNFTFVPYCKLIFAGNLLPRIKDNSDALYERILIVNFPRQFLEGDPDRDEHLGDKLKEERSEIFYWALCGLKRLREQRRFSDSVATRKVMMEFRRSNNPIISFVEDRCDLGDEKQVEKEELYKEYDSFCRHNGYKPTNSNNFFRELYRAVGRLREHQARVGDKRPRFAEGIALKSTEM